VYESKENPPLSRPRFLRRLLLHLVTVAGLALGSLLVGMAGYAYFEDLAWRDAFLNAAMLLGGMGPVESPQTGGGKLFAGAYALYSGLLFIVCIGIVLGPIVHRLLHKFHWDTEEETGSAARSLRSGE
jgi:hypothetical protein